jgi:hypothetical protein
MGLMTGIALGIAAFGTATSVIGQQKSGRAAQRAAESQAEQFEFNAAIADLQADDALARGADEEARLRAGVRSLVDQQRVGFAAQGVDVGYGSAADVQADAAFLGELDAQRLKANAEREAWGFQVNAEDLRRGADVARKGGQAARTAANWGSATTVLGTSSSLMLARYGWDRPTPTSTPPRIDTLPR